MSATGTIPFALVALAYLLAGLTYAAAVYDRAWKGTAAWLVRLALLIHTLALAAQAWQAGTLFATLFDTILFLTWVIMVLYVLADQFWQVDSVGVFLVPLVILLLLSALAVPRGPSSEIPGFSAARAMWHVFVAVLSYGLFTLACMSSILYLIQEKQLRRKEFRLAFQRLPSLESLDLLGFRLVLAAFPLLTLAMITGYIWAREAWRQGYQWDVKLIWTEVTWLIYGGYLVARALGWRGRRAAQWLIAGFFLVLVNYFAINIFFTRWHGF